MWYQFWTGAWWLQVWPNLAANVVWVPLGLLHHRKIKKHITESARRPSGE